MDGSSTARRHHHEHPHQKLKLPLSSLPLFYETALFLFPNVGKGWIFQKSSPSHATAHFCRHQEADPTCQKQRGWLPIGGVGAGSGGGFRRETRPELLSPALGARDPAPTLLEGTLPCRKRRHGPEARCAQGLAPPPPPPPLGGQSASLRALAQAEAAPANATLIIRDRADRRGPDSPRGWLHSSTFLC